MDYLKATLTLNRALASALYAILTSPFLPSTTTTKSHITFSTLRSALSTAVALRLSLAAFSPSTQQQYLTLAKQHSFSPLECVENGVTHGFWIGNPATAEIVLVWYHGGGYTNPASDTHMALLWDLFTRVTNEGGKFAVFVQKYDLSSQGARYPTQLRQAVAGLMYLIGEEVGLRPGQMLLGGDSAGGHLALSVLSHLLHPHPDGEVKRLDLKGEKFRGVLLVSPWTSFDAGFSSMRDNTQTDYLPVDALKQWSDDFLGGKAADEYSEANHAETAWWEGLDKVVEWVGVTAGGREVLVDGIRETVKKMKEAWKGDKANFEYVEAETECHDMALMGWWLGKWYVDNSVSITFLKKWVLTRALNS